MLLVDELLGWFGGGETSCESGVARKQKERISLSLTVGEERRNIERERAPEERGGREEGERELTSLRSTSSLRRVVPDQRERR